MGFRFNPPPGWQVPQGFVPPAGWQPDPSWPAAPAGWQMWVSDDTPHAPPTVQYQRPDPGQTPGLGNQAGFGAQTGFGAQPPAAGQPGFAGQTGFQGQAGFDAQAGFAGQTGFAGQAGFAGQGGFGGQPGYGNQGQPGFGGQGGLGGQGGFQDQFQPHQAYTYGAPPPKLGTNGFAIASLVLGLIGGTVLSLIFAIVALVQIKRRPQGGRGLAIAGIVLSCIWIVIAVAVILASTTIQVNRSAHGSITTAGKVNIFSLRVGDCFQNPPAGKSVLGVTDVTAVPCSTPHNAQVFAQFDATDASYPGTPALIKESQRGCNARLSSSLDKSKITSTMSLRFLFPEQQSWSDGKRGISCLVVDSTKDLTTSLLSG